MNYTALSPETFKELLDTWKYFLLDLRTDGEVRTYGEIAGTKARYDVYQPSFVERMSVLPKEEKYLIYCWHGNRSQVVRDWMQQEGFQWVCDLEGGIDKWKF